MVAISFVHPAILGGLALGALPIIIHILNRRRFKTMEWAAMDFLLKAAVRNRRRVRLENLLLLALRVLVVLLLILAVTRPFTQRDSAFAGLFGADSATERIILLDDSHSMRAGQGNRSAFDTARRLVKALLGKLNDERSRDRVTVLLGSAPRAGDERFLRVPVASQRARRLVERLDELRVSDGVLDVPTAIDTLLDIYEERGGHLVLHIVSDFRSRDWADAQGELHPKILEALARFSDHGEIRFIDVGSGQTQNVGVTELRPRDRAVIAGVPTTFVATVRNHGPEPVSDLPVTFRFGPVTLSRKIEGTLQPCDSADVTLEYTFRREGPAVVSAQTPTDILPGDDIRRRVVNGRKQSRVLLVDGEPEQEHYRGETDFLAAALAPPGKTKSGIGVDPVSELSFSGRELDAYDGVFLCNVYRLPDDRIARLEKFVRDGGGLVFFLGDQVDSPTYNVLFYGSGEQAGKKLLPLRLGDEEGSPDSYVHLAAPGIDHPVVRFLRGMNRVIFRTAAFKRFIRCEAPAGEKDVRVILHYTDEESSPALVEKSFGDGRVLLFTSSADTEWSNFPRSMLYLMLLQETARYVVKPDPSGATRVVGAPITVVFDPKRMQRRASLVPPAELGGAPLRLTLAETKSDSLSFRYDRTTAAGVYSMRLKTPEGIDFELPFALNVDPAEGDLRRAEVTRLVEPLPGARVERAGDEGVFDTGESDRSEFWRTLVYALVACAALETLLAWRFGHHKKTSAALEGKRVFVR